MTTHYLWRSHEWESATEEQVIAALLNPPAFLGPEDMGSIKRYHPQAKAKYLNLLYSGMLPDWCKQVNRV